MDGETLLFFEGHAGALPLYEKLEEQILREIEGVRIKVQKTQISFYCGHLFACASFLRPRGRQDRPANWITVTFGLAYRLDSPRIDAAAEPYPRRWTHHVCVSRPEEIDGELMDWLREAAAFARQK